MIRIMFCIENITTDEDTIELELPIDYSELKAKLMENCDYLVISIEEDLEFESDDIFEINNCLSKINSENPLITRELLKIILETSDYTFVDEEDFLQKICNNDFFYEKIIVPPEYSSNLDKFVAYYLCINCNIPFTTSSTELEVAKKVGIHYDWISVWDVYFYMGFRFYVEDDDYELTEVHVINMEDSE